MSIKYIFLFILLLPLQGCSFAVSLIGIVFDKATGLPLSDTTINLLDGSDIKKTNSEGFFEVFSETGPFQDPYILVTKDGYKPFHLRIDRNSDETNYIVKSESIFIDYDEPVYPDPNNKDTFITGAWVDEWSKEFRSGDTLKIYLEILDTNAEIESSKKEVSRL